MALHKKKAQNSEDEALDPLLWTVERYRLATLIQTVSTARGRDFKPFAEPVLVLDSEESRTYRPLEDEPLLFEEFANTPDSAEGVLSFANRYGVLGIAKQFVRPPGKANPRDKPAIRNGESLSDWIDEIRTARKVATIWELCGNLAEGDLKKYIKWRSKTTVSFEYHEPGHESHENIASIETGTRPHLINRWKVGETIGPAKAFIASAVNGRLRQNVGLQLLLDDTGELRPYMRAFNLLGAIWYQIQGAYSGGVKIRRCSVCNGWLTFERKSKTMHSRCATRIRQQRFRETKGE